MCYYNLQLRVTILGDFLNSGAGKLVTFTQYVGHFKNID